MGPVIVRKDSRARGFRIRVSPRSGVSVTIPWTARFSTGLAFLAERKEWVETTLHRQAEQLSRPDPDGLVPRRNDTDPEAAAGREELFRRLRAEARRTLPARTAQLAERYGFTYNRLALKHNVSNWGSCSRKGNLNLNIHLMRLPEKARDYVILHELCHLRHPNHGPAFHALLDGLCRAETGETEKTLAALVRRYHLF